MIALTRRAWFALLAALPFTSRLQAAPPAPTFYARCYFENPKGVRKPHSLVPLDAEPVPGQTLAVETDTPILPAPRVENQRFTFDLSFEYNVYLFQFDWREPVSVSRDNRHTFAFVCLTPHRFIPPPHRT